jgi:hypothetical protein
MGGERTETSSIVTGKKKLSYFSNYTFGLDQGRKRKKSVVLVVVVVIEKKTNHISLKQKTPILHSAYMRYIHTHTYTVCTRFS